MQWGAIPDPPPLLTDDTLPETPHAIRDEMIAFGLMTALLERERKNIEALTEASRIAFEGWQALMQRQEASLMRLTMREARKAILDDDDGAIDDQAEVQRAEAHEISGHAEGIHAHRHHEKGEWDDEHGDDRCPPIAEQQEKR